jgi:hypothetical protein
MTISDFSIPRPTYDGPEDKLRAALEDRVNKVRANASLTPAAKTAAIAKLTIAAKASMAELESAAAADRASAMKKATTAAFGTRDLTRNSSPAETVSVQMAHRDALARVADETDADKLAGILRQANDTGDELLARAAARQAFALGKLGHGEAVVNDYASTRPAAAEAINTLLAPTHGNNMAVALRFALPMPSEVGGYATDYDLGRLAESDPAPANAGGG